MARSARQSLLGPSVRANPFAGSVLSCLALMFVTVPAEVHASSSDMASVLAPLGGASRPGCAAGMYRDGALVQFAASGSADIERAVPIDTRTVFNIGSVSKQFTGFAVVLLAQRGALSLDDPLTKYVPELGASARGVKLQHLLHHTGGLRDYIALMLLEGADYEARTTREQALDVLRRQQAANSPPGTQYEYSNSGYFLLGVTVERVSGRSLKQFLAEQVFTPLGMEHTTMVDRYPAGIAALARGYSPSADAGFSIDESTWEQTGDGQVHTTIDDLARWERNFLVGTLGGEQVRAAMVEPGKLVSGERIDYAAGLSLWRHRGLPTVSHAGDWAGYIAHYLRFPQQRYAVAVLCNRSDARPADFASAIAERDLKDLMHGDVEPRGLASLRAHGGGAQPASLPAGLYRDELRGTYLHLEHAKLGSKLRRGKHSSPLVEAAPGVFHAADFGRTYAVFKPAAGARAATVTLQDSPQPRVYSLTQPWRPAALASYAGSYVSKETSMGLQLVASGERLVLKSNGVEYPLSAVAEHEFSGEGLVDSSVSLRFIPGTANRDLLLFVDGVRSLQFSRVQR